MRENNDVERNNRIQRTVAVDVMANTDDYSSLEEGDNVDVKGSSNVDVRSNIVVDIEENAMGSIYDNDLKGNGNVDAKGILVL